MAMLHTINKSPFDRPTLDSCLTRVSKGSAVLFIEDGIYAAMKGTAVADRVKAAMGSVKFYVLGPDVKARGMQENQLIDGIGVVDYGGFVDLVTAHENIQSWL